MPERPSFWSVALALIPAWLVAGLALLLVMSGVIGLAGGSASDFHAPWAFGGEPLELLASVPFALLGLALLTLFTRAVLPDDAEGRRPAWIPLALVLALTGGLATLPPMTLELGSSTWSLGADEDSGGAVLLWIAAAALIRRIPWVAPREVADPLPRRTRRALPFGVAAGLLALLAAPFAYGSFHPVALQQAHCGDEGCTGPRDRPHLSLHLSRESGAPVELRAIEVEGLPTGTRLAVEQRVEGVVQPGDDWVEPARLPAALPPRDDLAKSFDAQVSLVPDGRTRCADAAQRSVHVTHVVLRYAVHGREITDRRELEEPTDLQVVCPRRR